MFCMRCGAPVPDGARFCASCGLPTMPAVSQAPAPVPPLAAAAPSATERYLGGFMSPNLHLKGRGASSMGYGVYATDRRVIGVNTIRGAFAALAFVGGVAGVAFAVAGAGDDSAKAIAELDAKKDFDVRKEDIWGIEVRRPRGIKVGYLDIRLASGAVTRITIADKPEFAQLRSLMQTFYPERVAADP